MSDLNPKLTEEEDIPQVLDSLLSGILKEADDVNKDAYESLKGSDNFKDAYNTLVRNNVEEFYLLLLKKHMAPIDGLLAKVFDDINFNGDWGKTNRYKFFALNYKFVESHYKTAIEKIEGSPCCADKSRSICRGIGRWLLKGERINFDYTQEYTFHLPEKIFKDHEKIESFFEAIYRLYYGDGTWYIKEIASIYLCDNK